MGSVWLNASASAAAPYPTTLPRAAKRPISPDASPDLLGRDEIRHVALERALGEVGAELEQGHEGGDRGQRIGGRDAPQEHQSSVAPMKMYGLRRPQRVIV